MIIFRSWNDIASHYLDGTIESQDAVCKAMLYTLNCQIASETDKHLAQHLHQQIENALLILHTIYPNQNLFTYEELFNALPFINNRVHHDLIFIAAQDFLVDVNTGDGYKA